MTHASFHPCHRSEAERRLLRFALSREDEPLERNRPGGEPDVIPYAELAQEQAANRANTKHIAKQKRKEILRLLNPPTVDDDVRALRRAKLGRWGMRWYPPFYGRTPSDFDALTNERTEEGIKAIRREAGKDRADSTKIDVIERIVDKDRTANKLVSLAFRESILQKNIDDALASRDIMGFHAEGLQNEWRKFGDGSVETVQAAPGEQLEQRIKQLRANIKNVREVIRETLPEGFGEVRRDHERLVSLLRDLGYRGAKAYELARGNALGTVNVKRELNAHPVPHGKREARLEAIEIARRLRGYGPRLALGIARKATRDRRRAVRAFYALDIDRSLRKTAQRWADEREGKNLEEVRIVKDEPTQAPTGSGEPRQRRAA